MALLWIMHEVEYFFLVIVEKEALFVAQKICGQRFILYARCIYMALRTRLY